MDTSTDLHQIIVSNEPFLGLVLAFSTIVVTILVAWWQIKAANGRKKKRTVPAFLGVEETTWSVTRKRIVHKDKNDNARET